MEGQGSWEEGRWGHRRRGLAFLYFLARQETDNEFEARLNVAKKCPGMIIPRGKHETSDNFRLRMTQQVGCHPPSRRLGQRVGPQEGFRI